MGNLCSCGAPKGVESNNKAGGKVKGVVGGGHTVQSSKGTHKALRLLGTGTAADTYLFEDHELSKPVAIKLFTLPIGDFPPDAIQREVMVQAELGPGHINLINVYTLFLSPDCLGLVMEWGEGGSMIKWLEDKMKRAGPSDQLLIQEDEALFYFRQLISAVAYCHAHGIAHRDLKLDNTLLDGSNPPIMKLADFGFARHFDGPKEICNSHLGTPEYMSPELLHRTSAGKSANYDARRADVWAAGVMLVVWLCGAFAFDTRDHVGSPDAEEDLWREEIDIKWKDSPHIKNNVKAFSPEIVDLLDKIFTVRPEERITVEDIKRHAWYNQELSPRFQEAMDKMQKKQLDLEAHVSKQNFDKAKVKARSEAIRDLVQKACQAKAPGGKGPIKFSKNDQMDLKASHIEQIDLSEASIVGSTERTDEEAQIVRERFNRISVSQAVQSAFEGEKNQDLHNAAKEAANNRNSHH